LNVFAAVRKKDYRILVVVVFMSAILFGLLTERFLYRLSAEEAGTIVSYYGSQFAEYEIERSKFLNYVLKTELKRFLLMLLLSFSSVGIIVNICILFGTVYRYIFFLMAVYRSGVGSGFILCLCAVILCLILLAPAFLYCIRLSYHSYLYCKDNMTKLWYCTKYRLQTELKMGIIILLYLAFGAVVQSFLCTALFERIFR